MFDQADTVASGTRKATDYGPAIESNPLHVQLKKLQHEFRQLQAFSFNVQNEVAELRERINALENPPSE